MIGFSASGWRAQKYQPEIVRIIEKVIDSGQFLNGEQNQSLEKKLHRFLQGGYTTTVASGNDALYLALQALRLTSQDEVIFPVNAYPTAFPITLSRAKPVPVDVDGNGQIDAGAVQKRLNKNTKAIVAVHLYGLVAPIKSIREMIKGKEIVIIEDCAQAFGSLFQGKPAGTLGDIGCFSFYPTKNLGTLGDGGALWTKNKQYHDYFLQAKAYGEKVKNQSQFVSFHSRLPEIQAGILNLYLRRFQEECSKRQTVFAEYRKLFVNYQLDQCLRILYDDKNSSPVLHLLVIEVAHRDALRTYLKTCGVETHIHYPTPVHLLPAFGSLGYRKGDFPVAERLAKHILSLPFHPYLTKREIQYIAQSIRSFFYD